MINKVILIGNLGAAPELRKLDNNNAVAQFNIYTNESYKNKQGEWIDQTERHRVTVWGNAAERVAKYNKGICLYVEGKIKTEKYQDKDGNDRYVTKIIGNVVRPTPGQERMKKSEPSDPSFAEVDSHYNKDNKGDLPF